MEQRLDPSVLTVMTPRQREVCCLYFVQGLDQRDVAEMLGISQAAVSKLISRAGRALEDRGFPRLRRMTSDSDSRHVRQLDERLAAAI